MNIFSQMIPLLKRLIYTIIYTNLLVSFIAFCITFAVATYVGSSNTWEYGTIAFGATLFSYNLQRIPRLNDFQETNSLRHKWLFNHVIVLKLLSFIGALGACIIYFYTCFNWSSFILLGALTIISFLYAYRGRNKSFKPLRDIPFIKFTSLH